MRYSHHPNMYVEKAVGLQEWFSNVGVTRSQTTSKAALGFRPPSRDYPRFVWYRKLEHHVHHNRLADHSEINCLQRLNELIETVIITASPLW